MRQKGIFLKVLKNILSKYFEMNSIFKNKIYLECTVNKIWFILNEISSSGKIGIRMSSFGKRYINRLDILLETMLYVCSLVYIIFKISCNDLCYS